MTKYIFICTFIFSCLFQTIYIKTFTYIDSAMWANQAKYVETGDLAQFDSNLAYGHPGGVVILGVIAMHHIFQTTYENAIVVFIVFFNSLIIGTICTLCYLLQKESLWWLIVFSILSFNKQYVYATPPSLVVSLLLTLLVFTTLYIHRQKSDLKSSLFVFWALVSGLAISSRADIGSIMSLVLFLTFFKKLNWHRQILLIFGSVVTFCLTDPFMWFMPFQHVKDIVFKIVYHYSDYSITHLSFFSALDVSYLVFISIFLCIIFLARTILARNSSQEPFLRGKVESLEQLASFEFFYAIITITIVLYIIFLTSHYQAKRYFLPLILIWETLLPFFVFLLFPKTNLSFPKSVRDLNMKTVLIITAIFMATMFV